MAQKQIKQLNQATEVLEDDLFVIQQSADDDTLRIKKSDVLAGGWNPLNGAYTTATGYNAGNRSFTIDTSIDITSIVSPGMRFKVNRDTVPPTQCADLEASSSQYASKASPTGITFTDDFTCEAWIKLESYTQGVIISRYSSNGWFLRIDSSGQVVIAGQGAAGIDFATSYQSISLDNWVHVAASLDMSSSSVAIYIDGVSVPFSFSDGAGTSLTQAGNLVVGALSDGTQIFDGKLADVRVWSDIRTATEIQDNMFGYPSDTTGLVAHFKLAGDFTDASTNSNDLTAINSAVATDTDNPWNAIEYGIIDTVSATEMTITCQHPYGIPLETLTAPFYSGQYSPYGFDTDGSVTPAIWTNPYCFRGYRSADQVMTASVTTKVQLTDVSYDFKNNFDPITNYRYTITVGGVYQFSAGVRARSGSNPTRIFCLIYVNGVSAQNGSDAEGTSSVQSVLSAQLKLEVGDYVELYGWCNATINPGLQGGEGKTYFSGSLVHAT